VGGTPEENAIAIRSVLGGKGTEAHAAVIAVNAAALLALGGVVSGFRDGYALARSVLESGRALDRLERFARFSAEEPETAEEIGEASRVCA
jgi:anthranilate phosphoribosyltransferase